MYVFLHLLNNILLELCLDLTDLEQAKASLVSVNVET